MTGSTVDWGLLALCGLALWLIFVWSVRRQDRREQQQLREQALTEASAAEVSPDELRATTEGMVLHVANLGAHPLALRKVTCISDDVVLLDFPAARMREAQDGIPPGGSAWIRNEAFRYRRPDRLRIELHGGPEVEVPVTHAAR